MYDIQFLTTEEMYGKIPEPYPASRHIPEWFKNMPPDAPREGTVKRCSPFLEAMTAGYIIPAPADLEITLDYVGVSLVGRLNYLTHHGRAQYEQAPFGERVVVKFHNPWLIVTPTEYVCLITAPINRHEMPFQALTGIVETGQYYSEVNLPMICTMNPGDTYFLARGAPMMQVVPFRRDEWRSRPGLIDIQHWERQDAMLKANIHVYKDEIWKKLHFS